MGHNGSESEKKLCNYADYILFLKCVHTHMCCFSLCLSVYLYLCGYLDVRDSISSYMRQK